MNRNEIIKYLHKINVYNFYIKDDLTVDVYDNVDISQKVLKEIPINFNYVSGSFNCSYNFLTTLKGCPKIIGGDFNCGRNDLTNLEHAPSIIFGSACLLLNPINKFDYFFDKVDGDIYIDTDTLIETGNFLKYKGDNYDYYIIENYNDNLKLFKRKQKLKKILEK